MFAAMKHVVLGVTHGLGFSGCCVTPRLFNRTAWRVLDLDDVTLVFQHLGAACVRRRYDPSEIRHYTLCV